MAGAGPSSAKSQAARILVHACMLDASITGGGQTRGATMTRCMLFLVHESGSRSGSCPTRLGWGPNPVPPTPPLQSRSWTPQFGAVSTSGYWGGAGGGPQRHWWSASQPEAACVSHPPQSLPHERHKAARGGWAPQAQTASRVSVRRDGWGQHSIHPGLSQAGGPRAGKQL